MDSEVIKEIANQLGMAVDSTAQFISDILPQYASMKSIAHGSYAAICLIVLIIFTGIAFFLIKRGTDKCTHQYDRETYLISSIFPMIIAVLAMLFLIAEIASVLMWTFTPDAMFFDTVIKSIKG